MTESSSLVAWRRCREGQEGESTKGQEETFGGDEHVYYLDSTGGFTGVYLGQN